MLQNCRNLWWDQDRPFMRECPLAPIVCGAQSAAPKNACEHAMSDRNRPGSKPGATHCSDTRSGLRSTKHAPVPPSTIQLEDTQPLTETTYLTDSTRHLAAKPRLHISSGVAPPRDYQKRDLDILSDGLPNAYE